MIGPLSTSTFSALPWRPQHDLIVFAPGREHSLSGADASAVLATTGVHQAIRAALDALAGIQEWTQDPVMTLAQGPVSLYTPSRMRYSTAIGTTSSGPQFTLQLSPAPVVPS